jgi:hypothetical protein
VRQYHRAGRRLPFSDCAESKQPAADARLHAKPRSTNAPKLEFVTSLLLYFFPSLFSYSYLSASIGFIFVARRPGK